MDRRLIPSNGRVACTSLRGKVDANRFVDGVSRQIIGFPYLLAAPDGARDRQLLSGDTVRVFETVGGWSFVQADKDGYVGYLRDTVLTIPQEVTHRVSVRTTWAYATTDFKQPPLHDLHCNSFLRVIDDDGRWARIALPDGVEGPQIAYVPCRHLMPVSEFFGDSAAVAELFMGTPYIWGGNSGWGLDCSGLVQIALHACGIACPGDGDHQEAVVGTTVPPGTSPQRGDILFWKTHVAMAVDQETMIHANAAAMAVTLETIASARTRIEAQGDGPVIRHARLP
jgi:hypothetical protein